MIIGTTIKVTGGLFPAQLLDRIADGDPALPGTSPADYHFDSGTELNQAVNRAWTALTGRWASFRAQLASLPEGERATQLTREKWLLPLFQELGYGRLSAQRAALVFDERPFAISHLWGHTPIHLVGAGLSLDKRVPGERGAAASPPHGLVQDLLNHADEHLWAFLSNGLELRLLRDHRSLTRQAYVSFDLEAIFDGEQFSAFRLLWLLCHQSRVEDEDPHQTWLEQWVKHARDEGVRALERLRDGVERALVRLGTGFVKHRANEPLKARLRAQELSNQDYYRQLLKLAYRLIFLFVAEDRGLLLDPQAPQAARDRYARLYATRRLRDLAMKRRGGPHDDGWQALRLVMRQLDRGNADLALPGLGSFLWASEDDGQGGRRSRAVPDLDTATIANEDLFAALHALCVVQDGAVRRPVDWAGVQADELGSVYEVLIEKVPRINVSAGAFGLDDAAGNERKTSGSYYTPSSLVDTLLDGSLEPLLDASERQPDPQRAILDLAVMDPACGSGHFLVAAARRIAHRLARVRCGGTEPSPPDVQHAMRDVVGRCIYGVDLNPLAVELCKVSLWMEGIEPGRPLSFLDSHIQQGNALFGAQPELMAPGPPDVAWTALKGEDKAVARRLKSANGDWKQQRLFGAAEAGPVASVAAKAAAIEAEDDSTPAALAHKERDWKAFDEGREARHARLVADLWCASFVWPKDSREVEAAAPVRRVWEAVKARPEALPPATAAILATLKARFSFFHWHLAFPTVMGRGGFDLVLGNPPWDTLSPDRREFFGQFQAGMRSLSPTEQDAVIDRLLADPTVAAQWDRHQFDLFGLVHFLKNSGRFTLYAPGNLGKGDFNVYRMFAELALKTARASGYAAQVLPGGLYGGANVSAIRQFMFDQCELKHIWGLSNTRRGWFPGVDIDRFAAYAARRGGRTRSFLAQFGLMQPADLAGDPVEFDADFIRTNNPDTYAIPDVRSAADLTVAKKMLDAWPAFGDESAGPPVRHYQAEIHMGNDRERFSTDPAGLPLYEGRMITHFDHRAKTYDSGHGNSSRWIERAHGDPEKAIVPQWRVLPGNVPDKLGNRCERYRIAFGDVANPRNERSFTAALVPPGVICGHKVPTIVFDRAYEWAYLPWLAVANSFVMDWMARSKLSSPSMTFSLMDSLPFPRSKRTDPWVQRVAPLVLRLVCTAPEMTPFWNQMADLGFCQRVPEGTVPPDALLDEAARDVARAELDALVAHDVYGLTRAELADVLETFPVVKKRDIKAHQEYRTKRLVLEAFDRLGGEQ
ncbi:SAM-dependent methyltransferase [Myxococcota bacterium]|nr:SAM-dependent methyltransferase [Myxococcota bacterium]